MTSDYSDHWYNQHIKSHNISQILNYLKRRLPSDGWFIAGGAIASPDCFGDIDIFFENYQVFEDTRSIFERTLGSPEYTSPNAISYTTPIPISGAFHSISRTIRIQLICKSFETIDKTLENFDLSSSKLAMDLSGKIWKHNDYSETVKVCHANFATMSRIRKYVELKGFKFDKTDFIKYLKHLHSIRNTYLTEYYGNSTNKVQIKKHILSGFIDPIFLDACATYVDTLPARSRTVIYKKIFKNPAYWGKHTASYFNPPEAYSEEFQRHSSLAVKPIPTIVDRYPEDYL